MARHPITIRRDGSGSWRQNLSLWLNPPPGRRYGSAFKGLTGTDGRPSQATIAAGIVIFAVVRGQPTFVHDRDGVTEFGAWCDRHGIAGDEYSYLSTMVDRAEGAYYTACVPVFSPGCVLCDGPGGKLVVEDGSLLCRVGHEWVIERPPDVGTPPFATAAISVPRFDVIIVAAAFLRPGDNVVSENAQGEADVGSSEWTAFLPWPRDLGPVLHGADVLLDGTKTGERDVVAKTPHAPAFVGFPEDLLNPATFEPSGNAGYPLSLGGERHGLTSYGEAFDFLETLYHAFPREDFLPDPVAVGQPWLPGWYKKDGETVMVASNLSAYLLGEDNGHRLLLGRCLSVSDNTPGASIRVTRVATSVNGGQPFAFAPRTGGAYRVDYVAGLSASGTLLGASLEITASTGTDLSAQKLPGDSFVMAAVVDPPVWFHRPDWTPPCTYDHTEVRAIESDGQTRTVSIVYYKIAVGDLFEKDGQGNLAQFQKKTFSIPCDTNSPYSGILCLRPGVDIAAAWNGDPAISPAPGYPDFDAFESAVE